MKTLIVTPTYDEHENLPRFVGLVRAAAPTADLIIVDDASPDGTGEIADDLAARDAAIHVIHRPGKLGLGTAYVDAFRWGLARGYDRFFEMDADLSHDPNDLPKMFQALDDGADVVIGSRNVPGGGVEGWGPGRNVLSKGGSLYARTVLGLRVRDVTAGYKGFTRRALEAIGLEHIRSNGYSFQIEMTYRAHLRGMKIVEVPVVFVDRRVGHSKMNRRIFMEAISVVWKLRFDALRAQLERR
ncbi:MAG TPA: polyprenol monophosphomannose synthase [Polyangiaceae bacterium]|nr:polyprenol monophosphomannose synthase [Polyangiaceae bacterium]